MLPGVIATPLSPQRVFRTVEAPLEAELPLLFAPQCRSARRLQPVRSGRVAGFLRTRARDRARARSDEESQHPRLRAIREHGWPPMTDAGGHRHQLRRHPARSVAKRPVDALQVATVRPALPMIARFADRRRIGPSVIVCRTLFQTFSSFLGARDHG